jgi:hypothetical protein
MIAKLVLLAGVVGVGGYVGHKIVTYDPTVFPMSQQQVETMLLSAKTTLPRRDGDGEIKIWSAGRSDRGIHLDMKYADWAPLIECEAIIEPVATEETRVTTDCGSHGAPGSAMGKTQDELRAPMFEEHIQATLNQRAFNRATVDSKEVGVVMKNMGGMQREALKAARDEAQARAESSDWGSSSDSDPDPAGWGN